MQTLQLPTTITANAKIPTAPATIGNASVRSGRDHKHCKGMQELSYPVRDVQQISSDEIVDRACADVDAGKRIPCVDFADR